MCFYNLLRYTKDETLARQVAVRLLRVLGARTAGDEPVLQLRLRRRTGSARPYTNAYGTIPLDPWTGWHEDAMATLRGFPLDRVNWPHHNSHRLDLVPAPAPAIAGPGLGRAPAPAAAESTARCCRSRNATSATGTPTPGGWTTAATAVNWPAARSSCCPTTWALPRLHREAGVKAPELSSPCGWNVPSSRRRPGCSPTGYSRTTPSTGAAWCAGPAIS